MSAPSAEELKSVLGAYARLEYAATSRATCKFAACTQGEGGTIPAGSVKLTAVNRKCGFPMGSFHVPCFFLSQPKEGDKEAAATNHYNAPWIHISPCTGLRFPLMSGRGETAQPARSVDEFDGWASITKEEQQQVRQAAQLRGTGAGTKRKRSPTRAKPKAAAVNKGEKGNSAFAAAALKRQERFLKQQQGEEGEAEVKAEKPKKRAASSAAAASASPSSGSKKKNAASSSKKKPASKRSKLA
jgi:hypothetical protein